MRVIYNSFSLPLKNVENHPKNVRKDYGDLTELTESIREIGLLQNLVVVEQPGNGPYARTSDRKYWVVAGNRRLLALKAAYGEDAQVLCKIVAMDESEQIAMMLTENINRSSLTPLEEADGFQMMLDLGDTVDDIAKKTGFGKTTIRHRLNIAKIDKDVIDRKNEDGWQVSLKDFEKLEKVPPEQRSEVLGKATSPQNLDWQIENYAREEQKRKDRELTLESIEAKGIRKLPDGASGYAIIKTLNYGEECPDVEGKAYWREGYDWFAIVEEISDEEEGTEEEREKNRAEEEKTDRKLRIRRIMQEADDAQHDFVNMKIEAGGLYAKDDAATMATIWCALIRTDATIGRRQAALFFTGKRHWELQEEEIEEAMQQCLELSPDLQMLVMLSARVTEMVIYNEIVDWGGGYDEPNGNRYKAAFAAISTFGFSLTDEQLSVIFGDSELYTKED